MISNKALTKYELAEIKEFYDGTRGSIRELARLLKKSPRVIEYTVDYKGRKEYMKSKNRSWMKRNPDKVKKMQKEAHERYYKKHKDRVLKYRRKYYKENREKLLKNWKKKYKKYYYTHREEILKRKREKYNKKIK